ncbi:hypothetical protein AVEN_17746-1 [Araneus ventricosus]|uniref:Uncharacterized protein n=1 Tax=Araneus ventricosus TaxID=182803 RepID=A0A4Y2Q2F9_ARAVE|nr:hypothetical protein AVEN_17746-1 [Araneus ventricosus]
MLLTRRSSDQQMHLLIESASQLQSFLKCLKSSSMYKIHSVVNIMQVVVSHFSIGSKVIDNKVCSSFIIRFYRALHIHHADVLSSLISDQLCMVKVFLASSIAPCSSEHQCSYTQYKEIARKNARAGFTKHLLGLVVQ